MSIKIANLIEELIDVNNQIWHQATQIKTFDNSVKKGLSSEERVKIFLEIRKLNSKRSSVRSEIDKYFGEVGDGKKLNYEG